jgi:Derlin-2/3
MPANIQNAQTAGTGVNDWYNGLPPITRTHFTACLLLTVAGFLGLMSRSMFILQWPLVFKFQVRRRPAGRQQQAPTAGGPSPDRRTPGRRCLTRHALPARPPARAPQVWRLATNFFSFEFGFPFVFYMLWLLNYGVALERETYAFDPAGYLYFYAFCCTTFLVKALLFKSMAMVEYAPALVYSLVYIWSRHFPDQVVKIMGAPRRLPLAASACL